MVGLPGQEDRVEAFASGSESSCFVDTPEVGAFGAYGAGSNSLYVIDAAGIVVETADLGIDSLGTAASRDHLDGLVRSLLSP